MIKPSPGRIVWFYPELEKRDPNGQPLAAVIAKVLDDRLLNLTVSAADGTTYAMQHVTLLQPGDELADPAAPYACWMPYQMGQAAKTEAAIASSPSLEPLQAKILEIENGVDLKIHGFGESLDPIFSEIGKRLSALEVKASGGTVFVGAGGGGGGNSGGIGASGGTADGTTQQTAS